MSRYSIEDYDDMIYELERFLQEHTVSELLRLVTDAVEGKEERDND